MILSKDEIKKYDKMWQKVICHIAGNRCQVQQSLECTKMAYNGSHHIIPRWHRKVRWNFTNGIAVCPACHQWIEDNENAFMDSLEQEDRAKFLLVQYLKREYDNLENGEEDAIAELEEYCRTNKI